MYKISHSVTSPSVDLEAVIVHLTGLEADLSAQASSSIPTQGQCKRLAEHIKDYITQAVAVYKNDPEQKSIIEFIRIV